jgi:hypothetical protein
MILAIESKSSIIVTTISIDIAAVFAMFYTIQDFFLVKAIQ